MAKALDRLVIARAEALFVSNISALSSPAKAAVSAAISGAIRSHGGIRGCAGEVGAAYGEHPETAAARMRWARRLIEAMYLPSASDPPEFVVSRTSALNRASVISRDTPGMGNDLTQSLRDRASERGNAHSAAHSMPAI
jgi:hypothetical protein